MVGHLPKIKSLSLSVSSGVASVDNWGGGGGRANIHVSCFASLISFEIDCFYDP